MWILVNTTNYKFWVENVRLRTKCEFWPAWKDCGVKAYEVGGRAPPGRYLFIHKQIYIKHNLSAINIMNTLTHVNVNVRHISHISDEYICTGEYIHKQNQL